MNGVMEDLIKSEPLDDDFASFTSEELIIKTEFDDTSSTIINPAVPEVQEKTPFLPIIPKTEPVDMDDDCLDGSIPSIPLQINFPIPPPLKVRNFATKKVQASTRSLRCRDPNVCPECNQVFRTNVILQDHIEQHRIHKSKKSSPSKEKTSPRRSLPKSSPKTSPKLTPPKSPAVSIVPPTLYTCNMCEATFLSSNSLRSHRRVHTGNKPTCELCGRSFTYALELKRHKKANNCMTEEGSQILTLSDIDISIKKEVESDIDEPLVENGRVNTNLVIKQEPSECNTPTVPTTCIKQEPKDSDVESDSNNDYNELLLQELIDRKAKSIANQRAAMKQSLSPVVPIKQEPFDYETTPDSSTHSGNQHPTMPRPIKRQSTSGSLSDDANRSSYSQSSSQRADDFDDMIASNKLPNYQNKLEIINNLKQEYQKAKKKKLLNDIRQNENYANAQKSLFVTLENIPEDLNFTAAGVRYRYIFVCSMCPRRYIQRHGFMRHLTSSHAKEALESSQQIFELQPEMITTKLPVDTYCAICRVTLADSDSLKKHNEEVHHAHADSMPASSLQFRCDKCGKYCSTRGFLADHILANCGREPQYKCDECGKKFYTKSTLNLHKTMHTGVLPHKCGYCDKQFRTKGQLTVHTRTHTGERPFPCKVCDRRFTHRETLIAHLSRHIDMKRYKCYGCSMLFSCISGLKTHRITRMTTCGQVKLNARPVGPRVRVIRGNVIFEPQPKINPYFRRYDEINKADQERENQENQENVINLTVDPVDTTEESAM